MEQEAILSMKRYTLKEIVEDEEHPYHNLTIKQLMKNNMLLTPNREIPTKDYLMYLGHLSPRMIVKLDSKDWRDELRSKYGT